MQVYPVPAKDLVNIRIVSESEPVNLMVEIYDLIGNVIFKQNVKSKEFNYQLNLNFYPTNMFILNVIDVQSHQKRFYKIIKITA